MSIFNFKLGREAELYIYITKLYIHKSHTKVCADTEARQTLHHCFTVVL